MDYFGGKMQFARKIINAEAIVGIMELPDEMRDKDVEIIVLPINDDKIKQTSQKHEVDIIDQLLDSPLNIKDFSPFSRDEIYER